jgi:hypothetical protein
VKEKMTDWGDMAYDLDAAYIGGKYAFAYGADFVSDFIYDHSGFETNEPPDKTATQLGGKWGIIDSSGEILVPFIFEHILYIDSGTAFAKYEGKYGIIFVAYG